MTEYCVGRLVLDFDTTKQEIDILFTAEKKDEVLAKRDAITTHYSKLIDADVKGANLMGADRFLGCHFKPIVPTFKETYDFMKQFTFEYRGDAR